MIVRLHFLLSIYRVTIALADHLTVRGPCPGLNTLANHGLLPRSGKNITQDDLSRAMWLGVSQDDTISVPLFGLAATTNPSGDNTTFSLPDLGRHNILEHDASLRCVLSQLSKPAVEMDKRCELTI